MRKRITHRWRLGWSAALIVALLASFAAPLGAAAQPEAKPAALSVASVTGTVTDSVTGLPIEGAWVEAEQQVGGVWEWVDGWIWTGPDGTYELYLPGAGQYRITAWVLGYFDSTSATFVFDGSNALVRNLALQPWPLGVTGTVTDSVTGLPIEGAWVEAEQHVGGGLGVGGRLDLDRP